MKIKSITKIKLDTHIPVYDIEVPETENFTLASGVVVHNSKDLSDGICGAVWGAQQYYATQKKSNMIQHDRVNKAIECIQELNKKRWADNYNEVEDYSWL